MKLKEKNYLRKRKKLESTDLTRGFVLWNWKKKDYCLLVIVNYNI